MNNIQLITRAIEPIYHSNTRTRFKINSLNNGILPNLRLCNVSVSDVGSGAVPAYYGANSGALGLVKRFTLSEKGNPIEDLTMRAAEYMSFLNSIASQDMENSVQTFSIKSRNNIETDVDGANQISRVAPNDDVTSAISDVNAITSNSARFDLQDYFNFLESEDILVGFKDLELLIEWETDPDKIFEGTRLGGVPNAGDWTVDEPLLVFEEILDKDFVAEQAQAKRGTQTAFVTPELELLSVPATLVNGVPITNQLRLQSVKNKTVKKLLVATHDNVLLTSDETCQNNSRAQPSEVWQVYVNNASLFLSPLSTESRKLATLEDTFGEKICSWFQVRPLYAANAGTIRVGGLNGLEIGNNSYFGCDINDVVTDLRIELTRTRDAITGQGGNALTLTCFPLIQKYCVYTMTGEVTISYRSL